MQRGKYIFFTGNWKWERFMFLSLKDLGLSWAFTSCIWTVTNLMGKYSEGCAFTNVKIFIRFVVSNQFHPSFAKSKHLIEGHLCISEMKRKLYRGKKPNQISNWTSKIFNRTTWMVLRVREAVRLPPALSPATNSLGNMKYMTFIKTMKHKTTNIARIANAVQCHN